MKFRILVAQLDAEGKVIPELTFWESYDKPEVFDDPWNWAEGIVSAFNNSLRPGENLRKLLDVDIIEFYPDEGNGNFFSKHDWEKVNAITIVRGKNIYDIYECNRCGITGKRYDLDDHIIRDPKYKADKYNKCKVK